MRRNIRKSPSGAGTSALGPDGVEVGARSLRVGEHRCRSFAVVGYPREVGLGWLEPLTNHPGRVDVALHVEPFPAALAAQRLRRQLARLESDRRLAFGKGRLEDPEVEVAASDARELAAGLARGEERLFRVGLYITVHAANDEELERECARLRALCSSLLIDVQPATWRSLQGWVSTLPLGVDALGERRCFDTGALSAAYPFASGELSADGGVLYGTGRGGSSLVLWDRFACDNYNSVVLARSGSGKSYLAKLELLRSLYRGIDVFVVDPEDEYARLADAVGGAYVHLGAPGVRLNPFDLDPADPEALVTQALFIHTFVTVLLGQSLDGETAASLDRAILDAYARVGITTNRRSFARPAPVLADLHAALSDGDSAAGALARRLEPYVTGSHRGLFDGPTTTRAKGHLVVFSLRDLPDELKAVGTLLVLSAIWRTVAGRERKRRFVLVDEAWLLMRDEEGARFLLRMAKSARKHWCGLTVITQDAADLLGSPLGQAVVANAATQILLRQAPQTIDALAASFGLTGGERAYLLGARRGEGLLVSGVDRVAFSVVASEREDELCTSDPAQLADLEARETSAL